MAAEPAAAQQCGGDAQPADLRASEIVGTGRDDIFASAQGLHLAPNMDGLNGWPRPDFVPIPRLLVKWL